MSSQAEENWVNVVNLVQFSIKFMILYEEEVGKYSYIKKYIITIKLSSNQVYTCFLLKHLMILFLSNFMIYITNLSVALSLYSCFSIQNKAIKHLI